jgi:hypothetical protein
MYQIHLSKTICYIYTSAPQTQSIQPPSRTHKFKQAKCCHPKTAQITNFAMSTSPEASGDAEKHRGARGCIAHFTISALNVTCGHVKAVA